jgi:hypothetical protein
MLKSARQAFFLLFLAVLYASISTIGCAQSRDLPRSDESAEREHEEGEEPKLPPPTQPWGAQTIAIDPVERPSDTLRFHIGSPLFLRLKIGANRACEPFNGQPFFFDAAGSQLGWGFEEVTDSILFPRTGSSCERIIMLSSDNSNRVAEGVYTFKVMFFIDAANRLYSDTITMHAVRSTDGADALSYARFLQEQIVRNSPLLSDPETLRALFADGTPRSPESEVYRAVILHRAGDPASAESALESAAQLASHRSAPLSGSAADAAGMLRRIMTANGSGR